MSLSTRATEKTNLGSENFSLRTEDIGYRFAEIRDIPQIVSLARATYQETYAGVFEHEIEEKFGKDYQDEILPKELSDVNYQYFVYQDKDKIFGYAKLKFDSDEVFLDKLYFLKSYQGKGYGHILLAACFQSALAHGYQKMTLHVWDKNEKAIAFYKKYGFFATGKDVGIPGAEEMVCLEVEAKQAHFTGKRKH